MIRECFCESCNLHRMQTRELVAGRFQLNCRSISRQISDVGPVQHFDGFLSADKSGGRQPAPESLETYVRARHAPVAGSLDDLNVVNANHSFAVDVDELFVEHV